MKKKIIELVSIMLLLSSTLTVFAKDTSYPLKTLYPNGVIGATSSLFLNTKIQKPIVTGFETREEIESLKLNNQSQELVISEDAYSGKFALKIQKKQSDITPIRETEYFHTGDSIQADSEDDERTIMLSGSDICIQIKNNKITISGTKAPREMVSLLVQKNNTIAYINQTSADEKGIFTFSFTLKEKGTYQLSIGGSSSETLKTTVEIVSTGLSEENSVSIAPVEDMQMKCNYYTLMLKPMQNSETISFYTKVQKQDEKGNYVEEFALIKSDSDSDGVFKVGEDLSRGKWQTIQLNLTDISESLRNGVVAGLYMNANQNSEWLFDNINSDYKKINETEFNLSDFATGNVVHDGKSLRFADDRQSGNYNIGSMVVAGEVNVSDPISEIHIDSRLQFGTGDTAQQEEKRKILHAVSLETETCAVNDVDYDTAQSGTSKKVQKIYCREDLTEIPSADSMTIYFRPEIEKRFRLLLHAKKLDKTVSIKNQEGNETQYEFSKQSIYTGWYTGDIVLMGDGLNELIENYMIEYEPIVGTEQDVVMHYQGNATIDLKDVTTDDRTRVSYELIYEPTRTFSTGPKLELYEGDAETPYYATRANIDTSLKRQTVSHIIPKIKANTKMRITNLLEDTYDEIRISNVTISELLERDWNKKIDYADYALEYNKVNVGSSTMTFEGEEYAVVYPSATGYINTDNSAISWDDDQDSVSYDFAMYRILNLNKNPVCVKVGDSVLRKTTIWLQYGMADYIAPASNTLQMPSNAKVMLIDKRFYSNTRYNSNNLHYKNIDGLSDATFIAEENAIIYKNTYDGNRAYMYHFGSGKTQKISDDVLHCTSPDGTRLLLYNQENEYYVFNRTTMKTEIMGSISGTKFFFGVNNELFGIKSGQLYCYTINGAQSLRSFSNSIENCYAFDSSGNNLLLIVDSYLYLYKNTNGMWNQVSDFDGKRTIVDCALSNDATTAYVERKGSTRNSIYAIDLITESATWIYNGDLLRMTEDNMLLFNDDGYYSLYNPLTDETYRIFNNAMSCSDMYYNPETNLVTGILANGSVFQHYFSAEQPEAKYAMSFDGRNNWYAYSGGRWQTVSKQKMPNLEEMRLSGMTADSVNSIPASAYEKLYSDGNDILTVDVAIFMNSKLNNQTPVIENITVSTVEKDDSSGLFGIHLETYPKNEYRKINSLFPVENFGSDAECYYLLYIGNEWLYTYKDGELIKVEESADTLLEDMSESWITFKQYGMNAQELRRIPGEVLSDLFVNEDYANTEFGVIYVVKTQNDDTGDYTVTFRLSSSANFVTEEDIVVEIMMNGGDVKVIKSGDFSAADIKNLLSWIEARQSGSGEIFYRLKNDKTQHFLNYYMINSISVYSGSEYRAQNAE